MCRSRRITELWKDTRVTKGSLFWKAIIRNKSRNKRVFMNKTEIVKRGKYRQKERSRPGVSRVFHQSAQNTPNFNL